MSTWTSTCRYDALQPERGVCALINGQQIAIFRDFEGKVYALANRDPFSGAYIMSRGIVGTRMGEPTVASPMHKQVFSLVTGVCLDEPATIVATFPTRVRGGEVEVEA